MKIAIDGRPLLNEPTGVANLLISALNKLVELQPCWTFYVLINRNINQNCLSKITKNKNVVFVKEPLPIFPRIATFWYVVKVYFIIKKIKPDFFWSATAILPPVLPKNVKTILTVNDFVSKKYKDTMFWAERFIHVLLLNNSIRKADVIWAISSYTKSELLRYYPWVNEKRIMVGCSIEENKYITTVMTDKQKKTLFERFGINNPFLLFVGTLEPRKNLKFLLGLMPRLAEREFELLIVGIKGWGNTGLDNIIKEKGYPKDKIHFSGFVSNEDLVGLYNVADLFISSSIDEGFGLPLLEAMSCGCPVVCAHNSAMIELVDGAGVTVKGWDADDWIRSILNVHSDRSFYSDKSVLRAKNFNWEHVIKELIYKIEASGCQ